MKIGVNLLFLVPGEVGGSEPFLTNLVEHLITSEHRFVVFAVKGFARSYPAIAAGAEVVEVPWSTGAQGRRILAEHTWLALESRRRKLDVIHHGVGTGPFYNLVPGVLTIHDVQYRHYPENFATAKRAWLTVNVPWVLKRSRRVCVESNWVRDDLVDKFGTDPSRISVVPFGSEGLLGPQPSGADEVAAKYSLDRPYFVFPSRTYIHKNHSVLIEAFRGVEDGATLILTGAPWRRDAEIAASISRLGLGERVRRLGTVPRADLAGLYRGAVALTYPTRFEGFGAPALEAMSVGCPVIASNVTAVPEVVGDAGILLDPDDIEGWTEAMNKVLADEGSRQIMSEKSHDRARSFTWRRSAQLQIECYRMASTDG